MPVTNEVAQLTKTISSGLSHDDDNYYNVVINYISDRTTEAFSISLSLTVNVHGAGAVNDDLLFVFRARESAENAYNSITEDYVSVLADLYRNYYVAMKDLSSVRERMRTRESDKYLFDVERVLKAAHEATFSLRNYIKSLKS